MKLATFNANSIRVRLDAVLEWLAEHEPDVLAIQETKVENEKFPREAFEEAGWTVAFDGQKTYNGVALVSRGPLSDVRAGMGDSTWPDDKRILAGTWGDIRVVNTYVPNGTKVGGDKWEYKLGWLERFKAYLAGELKRAERVVWLGDINIAPTADDVFEATKKVGSVGHHPDEWSRLKALVDEFALVDCFREHNPGPGHYTFWEFVLPRAYERNLGWRIDHIYRTPSLHCSACEIDRGPRGAERPSDHTFVWAELS